jgi:excisionase family DNA binding protein
MSPEDVVTVAEIAEILKLNQQTVRNWIVDGSLPAIHVGRRVRVRWGGVEAMTKPAGPAIPGGGSSGPSADAQGFWDGEYVPLVALQR